IAYSEGVLILSQGASAGRQLVKAFLLASSSPLRRPAPIMIALVYSRESMRRLFPILVLTLPAAISPSTACAAEIDVNSFGAKGNGTSVDTAAIQKALDEAAKTKGTVVFHPGIYLTGSIFVKSNTQLRIDEGVELRGLQDPAAYPVM